MIEIEFISSTDSEATGKRVVFFDKITVGRSLTSNIVIMDSLINSNELVLEIIDSGIIIQNKEANFYHSNTKKVNGKKLHKVNDEIKVGDTTFKIIKFEKTIDDSMDLSEKFSQVMEKNPEYEGLFQGLEQELIQIEAAKYDE